MDESNSKTKIESLLQLYDIDGELEQQYQVIIKKLDAVTLDFKVLVRHWEGILNNGNR
ncbi:hypothetical protein [Nostoc sp. 'Peltigera malacea cyanobiont' DB3992]|uniref:hypothetical protein n=1 Tax=Nostoc sp. 'Peltigera malacea cyanobiont' DB3992 TaxID=1206980 RepID=UPI0015D4AC76|nr:hypothetical protein [Nostoc sp. 'Peltigera malacea cyanobiont' DB3992]